MKFEITIKDVELSSSLSADLKIPEFRIGSGGIVFVNILNHGNRGEFKGYLLGEKKPRNGTVSTSPDRERIRTSLVGPERGFLPHQTVKGYVDHMLRISGVDGPKDRRYEVLKELGLDEFMDCEVSRLRPNRRAMAELARGAVLDPDLLIVDLMEQEDEVGLQEKVVSFVRRFLKGSEKGAVLFVKDPPDDIKEGERFYSVMDNKLSERDLSRMPIGDLYPFRVRFILDDRVRAIGIIRGFPNVKVETGPDPLSVNVEGPGTGISGFRNEPPAAYDGREVIVGLRRYEVLPQINKELLSAGIKVFEVSQVRKGGEGR